MNRYQQWNNIFEKQGKVFTEVQEDIPKIAKLFKKNKIKKILDLGYGTGRHVIYFVKNGFDVYGIDISKEGLEITENWLKKNKLKADLKIGSIYKKLPYKNNFFDAIISTQVIHHEKIKTIRETIKELVRILRPNGFIFITVRKKRLVRPKSKSNIIIGGSALNVRDKIIAPRTCVPIEGAEKGLVHYLFNKKILRKEFNNFKNLKIWVASYKKHYSLLGQLKKIKKY